MPNFHRKTTAAAAAAVIAFVACAASCRKSPPPPGDASEPIGLSQAAAKNNAKRVQKLLRSGADKEAKDADGVTALMQAAGSNSVDSARLLIDAGADRYIIYFNLQIYKIFKPFDKYVIFASCMTMRR